MGNVQENFTTSTIYQHLITTVDFLAGSVSVCVCVCVSNEALCESMCACVDSSLLRAMFSPGPGGTETVRSHRRNAPIPAALVELSTASPGEGEGEQNIWEPLFPGGLLKRGRPVAKTRSKPWKENVPKSKRTTHETMLVGGKSKSTHSNGLSGKKRPI